MVVFQMQVYDHINCAYGPFFLEQYKNSHEDDVMNQPTGSYQAITYTYPRSENPK